MPPVMAYCGALSLFLLLAGLRLSQDDPLLLFERSQLTSALQRQEL